MAVPLGYYGLGDLTVFLFFGPVAVCGTYYVQALSVSALAAWSSLPMGFLITAILVVNNLRDIETDGAAGTRTLAVRIGEGATRWEYALLLVGALAVPVIPVIFSDVPVWLLLVWGVFPMTFSLIRFVWNEDGRPLNKALAGTGRLTLFYALLYGAGLVIQQMV